MDLVVGTSSAKADGMFRWVFCQLEILHHCFLSSVFNILEELPESLDERYKQILREINQANRVHGYRLLQFLTVAVHPLGVEERVEVLAVDFNADWRSPTQPARNEPPRAGPISFAIIAEQLQNASRTVATYAPPTSSVAGSPALNEQLLPDAASSASSRTSTASLAGLERRFADALAVQRLKYSTSKVLPAAPGFEPDPARARAPKCPRELKTSPALPYSSYSSLEVPTALNVNSQMVSKTDK
ncbi:hypothetical protein EDB87DRAFT_1686965 [Lactarius vividus]|nr:hypothetical protein EDB87DRAFT_1686965 [Lactarius vividus]